MFPKFLLTLPQKGLPYLPFSYVDMPNLILDQNVWYQPMITWENASVSIKQTLDIVDELTAEDQPNEVIAPFMEIVNLYYDKGTALKAGENKKALQIQSRIEKINLDLIKADLRSDLDQTEQERLVATLDFFADSSLEYIDPEIPTKLPMINYLTKLFLQLPIGALLMIVTLFLATYFTAEYREKTADFLFITPQSKYKIMRAQLETYFLWLLINLVVSLGLAATVCGVKYGIGNLSYPIFYTDFDKNVQSVTSGQYLDLAKLVLSMFLLLVSVLLFDYLISLVLKNTMATLTVTELFLLLTLMPSYLYSFPSSIMRFLPFGYLDLPNLIIDNNVWGDTTVTWNKGIIYLSFFSVLCLLLSMTVMVDPQKYKKNLK